MSGVRFSSLQAKLQILVWVAILPALLLIVAGGAWHFKHVETEKRNDVLSMVHLSKSLLERYISDTQELLLTLSHADVIQAGDPSGISAFFRDVHQHYPEHNNIGAVDLKGNVFASAVPPIKPVNAADMSWFQQALRSGDFTIGEYQICRVTESEVVVFGQPVYGRDGNNMKFFLFAAMDIRWLAKLFETSTALPDSHLVATDRNGRVLFHYPNLGGWKGRRISEIPALKPMLAGGEGVFEAACEDGVRRVYAFTAAGQPGGGFRLAIGLSRKAYAQPLNRVLLFEVAVMLVITLTGLLLAKIYATRHILNPLKALRKATERYASGDHSARVNLRDGDNEIIAYAAVFDRMAESIARNTSELALFQGLMDVAPVAIMIVDDDFRIIFANRTALDLHGYSREEFLKLTVHDLDVPESARLIAERSKSILEHGMARFEVAHYRKDRTTFPLEVFVKQAQLGEKTMFFSIGTDITERKKVEEALRKSEAFTRNILESVGEGFVVVDSEYKIISANKAYCRQIKCDVNKIVGKRCHEVSHHLARPCFLEGEECAPQHTFRTGVQHLTIHTHYDTDDNPHYIETRSFPILDDAGRVTAVIETLTDVTEKRSLEGQLRHAQKMEAVGTLAGGIAHDFNNILNIILGYGGIMQMRMRADDPEVAHLKEIMKASERAAHLTRSLLTFSRKQVMEVKTLNLNEVVEGFRKMLSRIIGEDVELRIIPAAEELLVKADVVQLEQVLMNLTVNARDAMPRGGALSIQTEEVKVDREFIAVHGFGEPGGYALLTVADTGLGMDDTARERIFEPYFTTKEAGKGTGLGLSIVYGIVKQHGGYINCYSEVGQGTTFRIYLPLAGERAEKLAAAEMAVLRGGVETVLLAEDDLIVRNFLKEFLETYGYTVIEAADGEEAVAQYRAHRANIRLLLFDLVMPKKNGKDAYEEIKALKNDIKVIFISGYAADTIRRFGVEEGADFISKPVLPNVLLRKVREVLDNEEEP